MNLRVLFSFLLLFSLATKAQQTADWQLLWEQMAPDDGDGDREEELLMLQALSERPLNLNEATADELLELPFLSDKQATDIVNYRRRYGQLLSLGELRMVASLGYEQLALLPFFCEAKPVEEQQHPIGTDSARYRGRHELELTGRVPLYEREGDRNGYLGYPYRHELRYDYRLGRRLHLGLTAAQDAGEPFLSSSNRWGYDYYGYFAEVRKWGCMEQLLLGKYRLSAAMGLVLGSGFSLGKQTSLLSMGRQTEGLRPHASHSVASYLHGAAAKLKLTEGLHLTLFASYRPLDATLNDDGTAATIITSGYHRTPNDIAKKHNTHETDAGAIVQWHAGGLRLSANAVFTALDRSLEPNRSTLYRQHNAHGRRFFNGSVGYVFAQRGISLRGETALNQRGAVATVNAVGWNVTDGWALTAVQRFYSYRYTALHANSFSEFGHVQNESGLCVGTTLNMLLHWQLQAYADYAYSPWARYRVSQSSSAVDLLAQLSYRRKNYNVALRYRMRRREYDNDSHTALLPLRTHRLRLTASATPLRQLTLRWQTEGVLLGGTSDSSGWLTGLQANWKGKRWQLGGALAYFATDDYDTRIYFYERQMAHQFAFPSYYGRGLRLMLKADCEIGSHLLLRAKVGQTRHYHQDEVGTGLQRIHSGCPTDIDLQLRCRL